ncbi:MAG: FecR family protein [Sumerlaeia bacterium]
MSSNETHKDLEQTLSSFSGEWSRAHRSADFLKSFEERLADEVAADSGQPARIVELPVASEPRRRPALLWLAAAAALLLIVLGSMTAHHQLSSPAGMVRYASAGLRESIGSEIRPGQSLAFAAGEQGYVTLDGERVNVFLHENSRLDIKAPDQVFLAAGEAWFAVEPNSGPFQIGTPSGRVEVLGTNFGVQLLESGMEVSVSDGRVRVTSKSEDFAVIERGTRAMVSDEGGRPVLSAAGQDATPQWAQALLADAQAYFAARYFPSGQPPRTDARE